MKEDKNFRLQLVHDGRKVSDTNIHRYPRSNAAYFKTIRGTKMPLVDTIPIFKNMKRGDLLIKVNPNNNFNMEGFAVVLNNTGSEVFIDMGYEKPVVIHKTDLAGLGNFLTIRNQQNVTLTKV